jgi:ureidoglycolate hydrolase
VTTLELEPLSDDAFAQFGRVLSEPAASADADGSGWRWWGEVAALPNEGRRWAFGYLALEPVAMTIDWAEHHLLSPEVVVASARDIAVYVAPPGPPNALSLDRFRVFEVPAGSGVVLDPGVWHGAPFALQGSTPAFVLLLEGTGRDDTTVVRFPDSPITVRQDVAASGRNATQAEE